MVVNKHKLEAEAALKLGELGNAHKSLVNSIRADPGDHSLRSFLFQLSAVLGDWERARKQLDVLMKLRPEASDLADDYSKAIAAEGMRKAVWAGNATPPVFGEPSTWIAHLVEAVRADTNNQCAAASDLRALALEQAPALAGTIDGDRFEWIADSDCRLGPLFEVILSGEYHWLPMETIASIKFDPPTDLRDQVWTIGLITLWNGVSVPIFIPSRYPGSDESEDAMLALGRKTEWQPVRDNQSIAIGQRVIATDMKDYPLLDIRLIEFDERRDRTKGREMGFEDAG